MVTKVNARGLHDWMVQRITAIVLLIYFGLMLVFLFDRGHSTYVAWHGLFHSNWLRASTLIVMFSVSWHAWIGLWTIFTDYVKNTVLRKVLEACVCLLIIAYILWVIMILW